MDERLERVSVCRECGMMYMKGLKKDEETHRKAHDLAVNGVPVAKSLTFKNVIFRQENVLLAEISHNKGLAKENLLAQKVSTTAKRATERKAIFTWFGYDVRMPVNDLDYRIYLYQIDNRAVGMMAMCSRPESVLGQWGEKLGMPDPTPRWSVEMVWVASLWRRQGIARLLAAEAASHLLTAPHLLAWSSPFTESGLALVKYFCPKKFYFR